RLVPLPLFSRPPARLRWSCGPPRGDEAPGARTGGGEGGDRSPPGGWLLGGAWPVPGPARLRPERGREHGRWVRGRGGQREVRRRRWSAMRRWTADGRRRAGGTAAGGRAA